MRIFLWPDGTWVEDFEYDDVVDAWRGDDYRVISIPEENTLEMGSGNVIMITEIMDEKGWTDGWEVVHMRADTKKHIGEPNLYHEFDEAVHAAIDLYEDIGTVEYGIKLGEPRMV